MLTYTDSHFNDTNTTKTDTHMNSSLLTVYECPYEKIRLGKDYDGGYVIANIPNIHYDALLSAGICDDISFEEAFIQKYTPHYVVAFDGSIDQLPNCMSSITFIKRNISHANSQHTTNMDILLRIFNQPFIKMDIEGHEFNWILNSDIKHVPQLVIEFHFPNTEAHDRVFEHINRTHVLVHLHANNNCGICYDKHGIRMPNVFECTYISKKYISGDLHLSTDNIPSSLDMPNIPHHPDIELNYPPFVNSST